MLNDKAKYILYDADRDKIGEQVIRSWRLYWSLGQKEKEQEAVFT